MSEQSSTIVSKVWGMCGPLRDDGVQDRLLFRLRRSDDPHPHRGRQGHAHGHLQQDTVPADRVFLAGEEG